MSKNVETKLNEMRPSLLARPASLTSDIIVASLLWIVTLGPSGATNQRLSAAGEGGSTVTRQHPQPFFCENFIFFAKTTIKQLKQILR